MDLRERRQQDDVKNTQFGSSPNIVRRSNHGGGWAVQIAGMGKKILNPGHHLEDPAVHERIVSKRILRI
jgi:hypothetical protein